MVQIHTENVSNPVVLPPQRRLKKTDKTERFATALEVEPQGLRHIFNIIVR